MDSNYSDHPSKNNSNVYNESALINPFSNSINQLISRPAKVLDTSNLTTKINYNNPSYRLEPNFNSKNYVFYEGLFTRNLLPIEEGKDY